MDFKMILASIQAPVVLSLLPRSHQSEKSQMVGAIDKQAVD